MVFKRAYLNVEKENGKHGIERCARYINNI